MEHYKLSMSTFDTMSCPMPSDIKEQYQPGRYEQKLFIARHTYSKAWDHITRM